MRSFGVALVLVSGVGLVGCGGVQEQLGLTKQSPDEFRVVARAPLTVPPSFSLRPPAPGAPRPQEGTPTDQARRAVFRIEDKAQPLAATMPEDGRSRGERSLLLGAGAPEADPNIRQLVNRETRAINEQSEDFVQALVFWRSPEPTGEVIDADAESRRLREAAALGEPVTGAKAPTIERREKGLLEDLF
jgi:hypothetical protein